MTFPLLQLLAGSLFLIIVWIIIPLARRLAQRALRPLTLRLFLWRAMS